GALVLVVELELDVVRPVLVADVAADLNLGLGVLEADRAVVLEAVVLAVVPVVAELGVAVDVDGEVAVLTGQRAGAAAGVGDEFGGVGPALVERLGAGRSGQAESEPRREGEMAAACRHSRSPCGVIVRRRGRRADGGPVGPAADGRHGTGAVLLM